MFHRCWTGRTSELDGVGKASPKAIHKMYPKEILVVFVYPMDWQGTKFRGSDRTSKSPFLQTTVTQ